jgi:hypothetical protein
MKGHVDVDELDRRLRADLEPHPELVRFLRPTTV